jgi:alpha-tubulin suppressor-like RCC1 family protein
MGTCAMRKDGIWCWGAIGDGNVYARPTRMPFVDVTAIALGDSHFCVLRTDRTVACAGRNLDGELGDPTLQNRSALAPVKGLANVVDLAAASFKTCAIVGAERRVVCFGADDVKTKTVVSAPGPEPTRLGDIEDARELALDWGIVCVRRVDGSVDCAGNDDYGQLGRGDANIPWFRKGRPPTNQPVRVLHVNDAVDVSAGGFGACVVTARGTVGCWGENSYGALGDGTTRQRSYASEVVGLTDVVQVARGGFGHVCARRRDGSVWCWGYAIGERRKTWVRPTQVHGIDAAVDLASGHTHACARTKSGSILCWGNNDSGQLGNGGREDTKDPVEIMGPER